MKTARLFGTAFSLSLRQAFSYRVDLFFDAVVSVMQLASSIAALGLVFSRTGVLAGWRPGEILVLVGTYSLMTGLRAAVVDPNLSDFSERVRDGRLDTCLLQPAPSIVLATCGRHTPLALLQSVLGIGVLAAGLVRLQLMPGAGAWISWLILATLGLMIGWATIVCLSCLAFWAPRMSFGVLHSAAWEFGRYPVDIYNRSMRLALTYVFPMAAVTTWPARALTRGPDLRVLSSAAGLGLVFTALSVLLWRCGLRRYTGATS